MLISIIGPIQYNAIVQASNNLRLAWLLILPWSATGLLVMLTVDFKKGAADALAGATPAPSASVA